MPQAFENIFAKYDTDGDGALTLGDLFHLMKGQRVAVDPFGVSDQRNDSYLCFHSHYISFPPYALLK